MPTRELSGHNGADREPSTKIIGSMSGAELGLALSVFLACTVEAVEALTIVLAVGSTRSWSSAIGGVGAAVLALAVIVAALGPAITSLPIGVLRVVVGGLLLVFGLQWLRKAILRASGLKAKHDESQIYEEEAAAARAAGARSSGFDGYAFTIAFRYWSGRGRRAPVRARAASSWMSTVSSGRSAAV